MGEQCDNGSNKSVSTQKSDVVHTRKSERWSSLLCHSVDRILSGLDDRNMPPLIISAQSLSTYVAEVAHDPLLFKIVVHVHQLEVSANVPLGRIPASQKTPT